MIEAFFDGVCEPRNPGGHAAWGVLVKQDGATVFGAGGYVGNGSRMSNQVAEYAAVAIALREVAKYNDIATIHGDSMLVICQLRGTWEVHGGLYVPYYKAAFALYDPLRARVNLDWIPRERNSECDEFSKKVLRDMGIVFRIQPERRPWVDRVEGRARQ